MSRTEEFHKQSNFSLGVGCTRMLHKARCYAIRGLKPRAWKVRNMKDIGNSYSRIMLLIPETSHVLTVISLVDQFVPVFFEDKNATQ